MSRRYHKTVADYAVIAVCPALIILMLTALVHFLVLCLYRGDYPGRLMYILFLFIVATTLIARIAIEQGRAYAFGYAVALGLATFVVINRFVVLSGPMAQLSWLFNLLLLALIWWLADRITFDCTVIDDADRASGEGLISSGGLFGGVGSLGAKRRQATPADVALDGTTGTDTGGTDTGGTTGAGAEGDANDQDSRALPRKRRGHQPGRWVLYLALAALPMFGLGQLFLPGFETVRSGALRSLGLYLFATLTLLVTTSFLGLRRYLRQRGTEMPSEVSTAWLGGGALLVAAVLLVGFAMPLPGRLIASIELPSWIRSPEGLQPSRFGWGDEGAGAPQHDAPAGSQGEQPEQQSGEQGDDPGQQGPADSSSDDGLDGSGQPGQSSREQSGGEQSGGEQSGGEQSGGEQSGGEQSGGEQSGGEQSGGEQSGGEQSGGEQSGGEQSGGEQSGGEQSGGEQSAGDEEEEGAPPPQTGNEPEGASERERESRDGQSAGQRSSPQSSPSLPQIGAAIARMFQLIIVALLLAVIALFAFKNRHMLRQWWEDLLRFLHGDRSSEASAETEPSIAPTKPVRPFASFRNPLADGSDPAAAVVTSFQALEAWGRERGLPRRDEETPTEYLHRARPLLGDAAPAGERIADAYNRIVYGRGKPTPGDLAAVQQTWQTMTATR